MKRIKYKKRRHSKWFLAAAIVLIGVIGFSGYRMLSIALEYRRANAEYMDLRQLAPIAGQTGDAYRRDADDRNADRRDADARAAAPTVSRHGAASGDFITLAAGAPSVGATAAPRKLVDFAALRAINDDVVAWIYAEGTPIDYPVVLGDDNAYYLDHTFFGRPGSAGAIFIDAANRADFSDGNTVVYGHHMKDGSMFAGLPNYGDQAYYDAHPVIYLYTPDGDYAIELFSGYVRDASALPIDFAGPEAFLGYVDAVRQLSDFESDVVVAADDRIVTLITCTYNFDDARYAVHGRLAPLAGAAA